MAGADGKITSIVRTHLEYADFLRLPGANDQLAFGHVEDLVAAVRMYVGCLPGVDLDESNCEVLGARIQPDEHAQVTAPNDVAAVEAPKRLRVRAGGRELSEKFVLGVPAAIKIRPRLCVSAGGSRRGRWGEQLETRRGPSPWANA